MKDNKTMRPAVLIFRTPWGWMGLSETAKGIDSVVLPKRSKQAVLSSLNGQSGLGGEISSSPRLEAARQQVQDYLSGMRRTFDLPLDLSRGTVFQRRVWRILQRVPYGKLRSYQWVATRAGGRHYARAVGNAVGANPLPLLVPCHRIVGQDASLGGFSGGLPTKRKLLTLEGTLRYLHVRRSSANGAGRLTARVKVP